MDKSDESEHCWQHSTQDMSQSVEYDGPVMPSVCTPQNSGSSGYASLHPPLVESTNGERAGCRPLPDWKSDVFKSHFQQLKGGIDGYTLAACLFEKKVITRSEMEEIYKLDSPKKKAHKILNRIANGSERDFDNFILCLWSEKDHRTHNELAQKLTADLNNAVPHSGSGARCTGHICQPVQREQSRISHELRRRSWLDNHVYFQNSADYEIFSEGTHFNSKRSIIDGWKVSQDVEMFAVLMTDCLLMLRPTHTMGNDPFQWLSNSKYSCTEPLMLADMEQVDRTGYRSLVIKSKEDVVIIMENKMQREDMLDAVSKAIKFAHEQEMSTLRCTFPSLPYQCNCGSRELGGKQLQLKIHGARLENQWTSIDVYCIVKLGDSLCHTKPVKCEDGRAMWNERMSFDDFCCEHDSVKILIRERKRYQPDKNIGNLCQKISIIEQNSHYFQGRDFDLKMDVAKRGVLRMDFNVLVFITTLV